MLDVRRLFARETVAARNIRIESTRRAALCTAYRTRGSNPFSREFQAYLAAARDYNATLRLIRRHHQIAA